MLDSCVVAVGDCAWDRGVFGGSYACIGEVRKVIPVDLHIQGCPPILLPCWKVCWRSWKCSNANSRPISWKRRERAKARPQILTTGGI